MTSEKFTLRDSGERRSANTGAMRDVQTGKPRYDLIPLEALYDWAILMAKGAEKYAERNWELGQPVSWYQASLWRHMVLAFEGDTVENHWAAILFNAGAIIHHLKRIKAGKLPMELADTEWARAWLDKL